MIACSSSLESDARRSIKSQNKAGNPIVLPTKVLAIARNPDASNSVYVAESAGVIKRVDLHTRDVTKTFRGPSAPLTSICVSNDGRTLFAGCWDKLIWSWDVPSARFKKPFPGHTDFVKTVMTIPAKLSPTKSELLVSGGADSEIIFWDIESGKRLNVLKGHSRGIQAIILDPMAVPTSSKDSAAPLLWSASSSREIRPCIIAANSTPSEQLDLLRSVSLGDALLQHNTSVYRLCFDEDGDMWTASADNTAQHLVRSQGWTSDTTLTHPDFVNDIAINETGGWVITACRDEEVRVWDRAVCLSLKLGAVRHSLTNLPDRITSPYIFRSFRCRYWLVPA